jgi:putative ABC transport system permease protein
LGVAIAACILIGLFVNNEMSFDKNIPDNNNKYRLIEYMHYEGAAPQLSAAIGPPIAPFLMENYSEIKNYTRVFPATPNIYPSLVLEYNGKKITTDKIACTDTSFDEMFGNKIIEGDKQNFLRTKNSIVLTQSFAYKIFGKAPSVGKQFLVNTGDSTNTYYAVSNVIADMPKTSHLQVDALLPVPEYIGNGLEDNYGVLLGPTYLQLQPGINIKALQAEFTSTTQSKHKSIDMRLQPVMDVHSSSTDISYDFYNYNKIDGKYINIFLIIALAIFLIACINFINLSIAVAAYRGKEIAMKKIVGASRFQIIIQVLSETFLGVFFAIALAIVLATIFLPFLNDLLNRDLNVSLLFQSALIGFYTILLFATTFLAGLYPAWLISSSKINDVLKNKNLAGQSGSLLRNILVTGQFTIAVIFIISLIVTTKQLRFLQNKDLGYSFTQIIKIPLDMQTAGKLPVLRSELSKIKGVEDINTGNLELGGNGALMGINYLAPDGQQQNMSVNFENVSPGYVHFFGMKILEGHDLGKGNNDNEYLINETLAKQIGYANPIGKEINLAGGWPPGEIAGVVKDFNYSSLHSKIEPLIIGNFNLPFFQKQLYIKLSTADISKTLQKVVATAKSISGNSNISYVFLDDTFKELYRSEKQTEIIIAVVGGLAMIIAGLGLLSIASFVILRRTKEIGIRKILGASGAKIAAMLSKDFLSLVLISILLAFPVAWWVMNKWLQSFAYRIHISWWIFLIAGAAAIFIALITISFQTIKAALANPVKSLRSE